ncbi:MULTISPECIES: DUF3999 domain-containing protein [unclassified Achromobacter]|uniref:DUF3999 domain-containing protein n=1 Tax=unclassified Achromobacter TaxID=2626865 RepID=UPI000B5192A2|nr:MULTISPECIES: DUF3999 domain-containing protein [unclassified Achromobacter]OWT73469.1 hypothetical protein CEY05_20345 [Achromobacter sp. HZ34]OWT79612.1 hypothetical protein CEY04_11635 [Achromobacter sp. HZ28]
MISSPAVRSAAATVFAAIAGAGPAIAASAETAAPAAVVVHRYALEPLGSASYYQVTLNDAVYAASRRSDLSDLRILDGAGEPVPFTFDNAVAAARPATLRPVRWFPLPATGGQGAEDGGSGNDNNSGTLSLTIGPDGSLHAAPRSAAVPARGGDIIDLGADGAPLSALLIHLQDKSWQGRVDVAVSADLRAWTPVIQAPLLKTGSGDATLAQERVELDGLRARYVRLRWPDGAPTLAGIDAESTPMDATPPTRAWRGGIATQAGANAGEYRFDTGGAYPVDRVQFDLPQPNTVARGQLYSRADAQAPWRRVAEGQLLRLQAAMPNGATANAGSAAAGQGEQRNPPWAVPVDADRYWRLSVDTRGGGLGSGLPTVSLGWRPTIVTFVARGTGPFVLAVGNPNWRASAVTLADLMATDAGAPAQARIGRELAPMPPAVVARQEDPGAGRRYVLWGALVIAVAMLAGMAWRLSRTKPRP